MKRKIIITILSLFLLLLLLGNAPDPSSLSERDNFSAGRIDGKLVPCLSYSSELLAGSDSNGSQVQDDC